MALSLARLLFAGALLICVLYIAIGSLHISELHTSVHAAHHQAMHHVSPALREQVKVLTDGQRRMEVQLERLVSQLEQLHVPSAGARHDSSAYSVAAAGLLDAKAKPAPDPAEMKAAPAKPKARPRGPTRPSSEEPPGPRRRAAAAAAAAAAEAAEDDHNDAAGDAARGAARGTGQCAPFHTLLTSQSSVYQQWQSRIMYYHWQRQSAVPITPAGGGAPCRPMSGFTRLCATPGGKPDGLQDEIPSVFVKELPKDVIDSHFGFGVLNRPHSISVFLADRARRAALRRGTSHPPLASGRASSRTRTRAYERTR